MSSVPHREHGEPSDTRALVANVTRYRRSRNVSGRLDHAATRTGVTGIAGACGNARVIERRACKAHEAVWQVTQSAVVATWLEGLETGVTPANAWPL